jgi:hypothetical protein
MWPFSLLTIIRERAYRRKFRAAVIVLLGVHFFDRLSALDRSRVEHEVDAMLDGSAVAPAELRSGASWDYMAAFRAVAMARLGIQPGSNPRFWQELLPKRGLLQAFAPLDTRPADIALQFHPFDQATVDARRFLTDNGVELPDLGVLGPEDVPPSRFDAS